MNNDEDIIIKAMWYVAGFIILFGGIMVGGVWLSKHFILPLVQNMP